MKRKQDFKDRLVIGLALITLFQHFSPGESFFLPKFMRRQATSPPRPQNPPLSSRGQHVVDGSHPQASYQRNNNRQAHNLNQAGPPNPQPSNFQVPDALCMACERFPWTPVPGAQSASPSVIVVGVGGNENNIEHEASSEQKPQHYEVQIHKEKGFRDGETGKENPVTTVVINDLGTNGPADNNRKPYAIHFDGAKSQNNNIQYQPTGSSQSINIAPRPLIIPSESQRKPTLLQPVPQQSQIRPVQNSILAAPSSHSQYGAPPPNQIQYFDNRPQQQPIQYDTSKPTLLQPVNVNQYGPPTQQQQQPSYKQPYPKIPPIKVGTIIAAQHNLKIHDIQPAKLVYQEHTHIYGAPVQQQPGYSPPKPGYGPVLQQQNYPQSYKLPILNSRPSVGAIAINQIPLESIPNYVQQKPPNNYAPPIQGPSIPTGFMKPPGPPAGYAPPQQQNYAPPQQQNYAPPQQQNYAPAQQQGGYLPPAPPQHGYNQQQQQGFRQPRPFPPAQEQGGYLQPPPPPPPQQQQNDFSPRPQQQYGNFPPPPPQQQHFQYPPPQQPYQKPPPQDKPLPPQIPQRPPPLNTLYGTPNKPPVPELEMRPPPQQPSYFAPQQNYGSPQPGENQQQFFRQPQPNVDFGQPQPTALTQSVSQTYQSHSSVDSSSSDQNYPGIDIRIPSSAAPSSGQPVAAGEYSQQSITNVHVLRSEVQPQPSLSPPTKPFSRPAAEETLKPETEYVKNPHIQSLNREPAPVEQAQPVHPSEAPSLPASGGGRWEVVPATQYDITHLFNKNNKPTEYKSNVKQRKRPLPVPVPVPISESHVANSAAPVFVVGHHRPTESQQQQLQQQTEQGNGGLFQPVHLETTVYAPTANNEQHQSTQYATHQSQFDRLPPAVVRALYNSQRTSFLTHQHLTPENEQSNRDHNSPIYVNSVTVSEAPPEQETRNSESQVDPNKGNTQNNVHYNQKPHDHPHVQNSDQDQTVVNCQNSPQWVIPTIGRNPTYVRHQQPAEGGTSDQLQEQPNKQFVYYYPSPMSSVYWVEKPSASVSTADTKFQYQNQQHQQSVEKNNNYESRVPVTTILQQQYSSESEANEAAQQAIPTYVKLSTVVSSTSNDENIDNSNSLVDPVGYENYSYEVEQQNQESRVVSQDSDKNTFVQPHHHHQQQQVVEEDDENDEGSSSIIQQVSTQAPYDILSFAKEPVFGVQTIEDVSESADVYEASSTPTSEFTSTPSSYYTEQDSSNYVTNQHQQQQQFKPNVSFKSFSSIGGSSTSSPYYFIQQHHQTSIPDETTHKLKLPKHATTDDNSFHVVYDTKVSHSNNNNEIVGPTTLAECFTTEPTTTFASTTESPTSTDIYAAGTSTVGSADDFTSYENILSTTFSPYRVNTQNRIRLHSSSRFPSGRPSPTTPTPISETTPITSDGSVAQDVSPGSASAHVPIYRPAVTIRGESQFSGGFSTPISSQKPGLKATNLVSVEDIYKSNEMKQLGQDVHTSSSSTEYPVSSDDDHEEEQKKEEPPNPPFSRISSTSRKVPAFIPSRLIYNQVQREPIIVESVPVAQSSDQQVQNATSSSSRRTLSTTTPATGSNMSTKIVKTVRVRQRMRTGANAGTPGMFRARLAAAGSHGGPSRIKVVQRPASQDYIKNFPEYAIPEGDVLEEDEQKEVKNALIDIKKVD